MEQIETGKVQLIPNRKKQCGIVGTQMQVIIDGKEEGIHCKEIIQAEEHFHQHGDNMESHSHEHVHNNTYNIENYVSIKNDSHTHNLLSHSGEIYNNASENIYNIENSVNVQVDQHIKKNVDIYKMNEKVHTHSHLYDNGNTGPHSHEHTYYKNRQVKCHTHTHEHSHMDIRK